MGDGGGIPPFVPLIFILFFGIVITMTVVKMNVASRMAEKAGLDPRDAALTSLLNDDGVSAAYLASNLQGRAAAPPVSRTIEQRLGELARLRDQDLITPEEYETRRTRILDEV